MPINDQSEIILERITTSDKYNKMRHETDLLIEEFRHELPAPLRSAFNSVINKLTIENSYVQEELLRHIK